MKLSRWTLALLVALLSLCATATASAQEAASEPAADTLQEDLDNYWADRRGVRVLQRRLFSKVGEANASLLFGAVPNDPFTLYFPLSARFGYWSSEQIGFEVGGSYLLSSDTDLESYLEEPNEISIYLRDLASWRANATVLWSPIYGKFSLLGRKLAHFDWFFGGGIGVVGVDNYPEGNLVELQAGIQPEAILTTGWMLHFSENLAGRIDYRQHVFQKDSGGVTLPSEISFGATYFF